MNVAKLYRVAIVAEQVGVKRTTLLSAIKRGDVPSYVTACGLVLVAIGDVERWRDREYKTGRPRGEQS